MKLVDQRPEPQYDLTPFIEAVQAVPDDPVEPEEEIEVTVQVPADLASESLPIDDRPQPDQIAASEVIATSEFGAGITDQPAGQAAEPVAAGSCDPPPEQKDTGPKDSGSRESARGESGRRRNKRRRDRGDSRKKAAGPRPNAAKKAEQGPATESVSEQPMTAESTAVPTEQKESNTTGKTRSRNRRRNRRRRGRSKEGGAGNSPAPPAPDSAD
jgi:hypothetical protein